MAQAADTAVNRVDELFRRLDLDGDGFLNEDEVVVALESFGLEATDENLAQVMRELDLNHDGKIDLAEFRTALGGQMGSDQHDSAWEEDDSLTRKLSLMMTRVQSYVHGDIELPARLSRVLPYSFSSKSIDSTNQDHDDHMEIRAPPSSGLMEKVSAAPDSKDEVLKFLRTRVAEMKHKKLEWKQRALQAETELSTANAQREKEVRQLKTQLEQERHKFLEAKQLAEEHDVKLKQFEAQHSKVDALQTLQREKDALTAQLAELEQQHEEVCKAYEQQVQTRQSAITEVKSLRARSEAISRLEQELTDRSQQAEEAIAAAQEAQERYNASAMEMKMLQSRFESMRAAIENHVCESPILLDEFGDGIAFSARPVHRRLRHLQSAASNASSASSGSGVGTLGVATVNTGVSPLFAYRPQSDTPCERCAAADSQTPAETVHVGVSPVVSPRNIADASAGTEALAVKSIAVGEALSTSTASVSPVAMLGTRAVAAPISCGTQSDSCSSMDVDVQTELARSPAEYVKRELPAAPRIGKKATPSSLQDTQSPPVIEGRMSDFVQVVCNIMSETMGPQPDGNSFATELHRQPLPVQKPLHKGKKEQKQQKQQKERPPWRTPVLHSPQRSAPGSEETAAGVVQPLIAPTVVESVATQNVPVCADMQTSPVVALLSLPADPTSEFATAPWVDPADVDAVLGGKKLQVVAVQTEEDVAARLAMLQDRESELVRARVMLADALTERESQESLLRTAEAHIRNLVAAVDRVSQKRWKKKIGA